MIDEDDVAALLDLWSRDRLAEHKRRALVRQTWPELAQRLDDLLDSWDES